VLFPLGLHGARALTPNLRQWAAGAEELLDDPRADAADVVSSLRDIARINRAFGGRAAPLARLGEFLAELASGTRATLLDVGTGSADIPCAAARLAARRGVQLAVLGLERHPAAAREARRGGGVAALIGDGGALPFANASIDFVLCAKLLHHLPGEAGCRLLREMNRVARRAVVIADLRRSVVAALGIWLASFPMRFHPATRRDAVISVFRGFSSTELAQACRDAGVSAAVRRHPGWNLTAAWRPARPA
jgi:ubiquinone/menaquinone biosynthesis C-methylase UbiE